MNTTEDRMNSSSLNTWETIRISLSSRSVLKSCFYSILTAFLLCFRKSIAGYTTSFTRRIRIGSAKTQWEFSPNMYLDYPAFDRDIGLARYSFCRHIKSQGTVSNSQMSYIISQSPIPNAFKSPLKYPVSNTNASETSKKQK